MSTLRLRPGSGFRVTDQGVVAASPEARFEVKGSDSGVFLTELVPLLDGSRTEDELAVSLDGYSEASVRSVLRLLVAKGMVEEVGSNGSAAPGLADAHVAVLGLEGWGAAAAADLAAAGVGQLTLWDDRPGHGAPDATSAQAAVAGVRVAAPDCDVRSEPAPGALHRPDMGPIDVFGDAPPSLLVVTSAAERLLVRFQATRAAVAADVPMLTAHLEGAELWLGPARLATPGPCWNCLRMRRLAHDDQVAQAHAVQGQLLGGAAGGHPAAWYPQLAPAAGNLIATLAVELLTGRAGDEVADRVRIHDLAAGTVSDHRLAALPWCPVCGGAEAQLAAGHAPAADAPGTDVDDLEALLAQMPGWVDHRIGVIRSLTVTPAGPPVPLSGVARLANYTEGDPSNVAVGVAGGGKGLVPFEAQRGAIGEAIERYSASRNRTSDLHRASFAELTGDAIDPRDLVLYDEAVYRSPTNPYVPFDPHAPMNWARGTWFGTDDPVWVPAHATFFEYRLEPDRQLFQITSNGLAAGASPADAAIRAVFELVERDATMLTWLCQLPARPVTLDGSLEAGEGGLQPGLVEVVGHMHALGIRIEMYLIDLGTGLPTIFCLGFGDGVRSPAVASSLACHADVRVAVYKALMEQAQIGPYLMSVPAERRPTTAEAVVSLEDHAFYYVAPGREDAFDFLRKGDEPPVALRDLPPSTFPTDVDGQTAYVAEALDRAGLRVAVVDVTAPDVRLTPFSVVRAVGPHLQPIHFGYGLRRLDNPRLRERLGPHGVHPDPHPVA